MSLFLLTYAENDDHNITILYRNPKENPIFATSQMTITASLWRYQTEPLNEARAKNTDREDGYISLRSQPPSL